MYYNPTLALTDKQTDGRADKQIAKQAGRQADRQVLVCLFVSVSLSSTVIIVLDPPKDQGGLERPYVRTDSWS